MGGFSQTFHTEVVVFDDPEHWVEDEDYVTAERRQLSALDAGQDWWALFVFQVFHGLA